MTTPNYESLIDIVKSFNPWWETNEVPDYFLKKFKRTPFYQIQNFLEKSSLKRSILLSGLRRVGKTVILYQLIDKLIDDGVDPKKIIYISFDHPTLKDTNLNELLKIYHDQIYSNKDVYYIFDEIQYVSEWDQWLKIIYDQQPQTQVIATGSASPVILKGQYESGVGRWITFHIPTLSFYEYCELLNIERPQMPEMLKITDFLNFNSYEFLNIKDQLKKLEKPFYDYLKTGGFPEIVFEKNELVAKQAIRDDVINKVVNSDLPQLYNIRNIRDLERIFLYFCDESSNIISFETIAKEFTGTSRSIVEKYVKYLESANLIKLSWPINLEGKKILKAQPKVYLADSSISSAIKMKRFEYLSPEELGKMVETTVFNNLSNLNQFNPLSIGYFRNSRTQKEIDIIIENYLKDYSLIEVKYRDKINISKTDAINKYSNNFQVNIVVTKKDDDFKLIERKDSNILLIPAYAFLYLIGYAENQNYNSFELL